MTDAPLANRVALVTGGVTGFGFAAAQALVSAGADIVICARRAGKLAAAVARITQPLPRRDVFATVADLTVPETIEQLAETVLERYGRLDVLVNNAAVLPRVAPWEEQTLGDIDTVLATNLRGPILVTLAFLRTFKQQGYGRIINVVSGLAWKVVPGFGPYSAAKAGLVSFTRTLAAELAGWDILVNAIDPGIAKTELNPSAPNHERPEKIMAGVLRLATLPTGGPTGGIFKKDGTTRAVPEGE